MTPIDSVRYVGQALAAAVVLATPVLGDGLVPGTGALSGGTLPGGSPAGGPKRAARGVQLPTSVADFFQPGTQPEPDPKIFRPVVSSFNCQFCHAEYLDDVDNEPWDAWTNSMMGQAVRDPVWLAAVTIANQDAVDAGEYCIRCHAPGAWLGGRSLPSDGSGFIDTLIINDFEGIQCHFCHRNVNPVLESDSPPEDADILAALEFPPGAGRGNGRFVVDPSDVRRGPFQDIAENPDMNPHGVPVLYSPYHRRSEMCATCHDLGNPVFSRQEDGTYAINGFEAEHPTQDPYDMFPEQRTYSEWLNSQFASGGVLFEDRRFGGNHPTGVMEECQDCHMPDQIAGGCNLWENDPWYERQDLPQHSFAGVQTWVLDVLLELYPDGEAGLSIESVDRSKARNIAMLEAASDLQAVQRGDALKLRTVNYSGHKLPTGYPEGRRMWLHIRYFDADEQFIEERGAYDFETAELDLDGTKLWRCVIGTSEDLAGEYGLEPGPTQHLVLANEVVFDNRIPPVGFDNESYGAFGGAPTGQTYEDGQYWDDTVDPIPTGAAHAIVTLYYQSMTKEYIEFLRDANVTNDNGQFIYDLWADEMVGRKALPIAMDMVGIDLTRPVEGDADADGDVDFDDLLAVLSAWGACPPPDLCGEDLDDDGVVGFLDILAVLSSWGA